MYVFVPDQYRNEKKEIAKLKKTLRDKEKAVDKAMLQLQHDTAKFETFLAEKTTNLHDELKRAEKATKEKNEITAKLKLLTSDISKVELQSAKTREMLEVFKEYKKFLDRLSPPEYHARLKHARDEARRKAAPKRGHEPLPPPPSTAGGAAAAANSSSSSSAQISTSLNTSSSSGSSGGMPLTPGRGGGGGGGGTLRPYDRLDVPDTHSKNVSTTLTTSTTTTNALPMPTATTAIDAVAKSRPVSAAIQKMTIRQSASRQGNREDKDKKTDEEDDDLDLVIAPHFERPEQLNAVFTKLEEKALFLIQNLDEAEAALAELKQQKDKIRNPKWNQEEDKTRKKKVEDVQAKITRERERQEQLSKRQEQEMVAKRQKRLLDELELQVKQLYLGVDPRGTQTDIVDMLKEIEVKLDDQLRQLSDHIRANDFYPVPGTQDQIPLVQHALRHVLELKNQNRRERNKQRQDDVRKRKQAEYMARSNTDVFKRTGRQLMTRSKPVVKRRVNAQNVKLLDEEEEDRKRFLNE